MDGLHRALVIFYTGFTTFTTALEAPAAIPIVFGFFNKGVHTVLHINPITEAGSLGVIAVVVIHPQPYFCEQFQ
jgi:hypothetical protein